MSVNFCQTIRNRWPEAIRPLAERNNRFFPTGLSELDRIFSSGQGLPCGQLIEITGGASSGKTSLLFRLLGIGEAPTINGGPPEETVPGRCPHLPAEQKRRPTPPGNGSQVASVPATRPGGACELTPASVRGGRRRIAYVDFGNTFFPDDTAGIDLSRLLVIRPHKQVASGAPPLAAGFLPPTINGGPPERCRQASRLDGDGVGQRRPTPLNEVASVPATRPVGSCELTPAPPACLPRRVTPPPASGGSEARPDATPIGTPPLGVGSVEIESSALVRGGRPRPPRENPTVNGGPPEKPSLDPLTSSLRAAELLLRDRHVEIVVFDLVGCRTPLPISLIHRLRLKTVRALGLVIFLTETTTLIPSSMASLRLEVERSDLADHYRITVTKSRLCAEGIRLEVAL